MNAYWGSARKPFLLLCFFLLIQIRALGQTAPLVVENVDNAQRVTLSGNVHPLAQAQYAHGAVVPSQPMPHILLLLQRSGSQEAALQSYMQQQQDKSSSNYHVWLTPQQFGAQYGPTDSDIQAVTQWLTSQGFTVEKVYSGKTIIQFSGTAAQLQTAFGTVMQNYEVNGKAYIANANDPQIPTALAPVIAGIVSLNNFPRQSHIRVAGHALKIAGKPGYQPLITFPVPGSSTDFYGVGPADFATIYNSAGLISAGTNGSGQTIAIVGETDINVADVQAFRQYFGLPANFTSSNLILNGEDPGITSTGEEVEADLDVQWSGAAAPNAIIDFVVSASTPVSAGIDLSSLYIIENNLAGVMSESYGNCEAALGTAGNAFYNSMWEQAAAQGITVILSSGDGGSAGCDDFDSATVATQGLAVSGLASTPYNVALGGTDFDDVNKWTTYWSATNNSTTGASALSYIPEIPWNQSCAQIGLTGCGTSAPQGSFNIVAGSGGASSHYPKPTWQMGVSGMPNDSHRDLPDVSLFASPGFDNSGYVICAGDGTTISGPSDCNSTPGTFSLAIVGGTSASAPAFAGVMALVNQYESAHGGSARQGNANYVLYPLAKKSGSSCASSATEAAGCVFNDVVKGNSFLPTGAAGVGTNSVPCKGATPNCSVSIASANGVLVEPTSASTEAYTVNSGYDLATGLGSVNINNLVTKWSTVSTVATTTTLTLSPTTGITHGTSENVTVNITVTPTSGTATGDVALIAELSSGATQGLDQLTLASGKITNASTNSLPGGTYQVHAHYTGDGINAPSDSAPVSVTVGKENSQTFIVVPTYDSSGNQTNGNATTVTYGSNYVVEMVVANSAATANPTGFPNGMCIATNPAICPTGSVTLTDNGSALGTGAGGAGIYHLNTAATAQNLTPNLLTGGTHSLVATYSGDNSYNTSTSATATLIVTPVATELSVPYIAYSPEIAGTAVMVSSNVTANIYNGVAPTGTITFYDGTTVIPGTVTYTSNPGQLNARNPALIASITANFTTSGTHAITSQYSGDANYQPTVSAPWNANVLYPTTISATASPATVTYGNSVTVTATATSSYKNPAMTGQIQFFVGGVLTPGSSTVLSTDGSGNQVLTATLVTTTEGNGNIQVTYSGDNNFEGGSTGVVINVSIPDFTIPAVTPVTVTAGQSQTVTVMVTPASNTPSPVTLSILGNLPSGMNVSFNPSTVNLSGSPVPVQVTVSTAGPTQGATASIRKASTSFLVFSGRSRRIWWSLSFCCAFVLLILLVFKGAAQRTRAVLYVGSVAVFTFALGCGGGGGGGNVGGGGGGGGGPVATTITLTSSSSKVPVDGTFTLTATVNSTKPVTGTINIFGGTIAGGGSGVAPPIPVVNGQATATVRAIPSVGTYPFFAQYSGDSNNLPSESTTNLMVVYTGTVGIPYQGQTGVLTHQVQLSVTLQ